MTAPDLSRANWRKSARSGGTGGNCVEVARNLPGVVAVRDSKDAAGPALVLTPVAWKTFASGVRDGDFDLS
jgi:Domain of unknown function (DUF397)